MVRKIHTFRGEAAFSSWLYRIAVNAAYQRLRSGRAHPEVPLEPFLPVFDEEGRLAEPVADWSAQLEDPAVAAETRAALERAIGRLPEEYRLVVVLHDVEGLPNDEVADILGLTLAAAKSRLHRDGTRWPASCRRPGDERRRLVPRGRGLVLFGRAPAGPGSREIYSPSPSGRRRRCWARSTSPSAGFSRPRASWSSQTGPSRWPSTARDRLGASSGRTSWGSSNSYKKPAG